MAWTLSTHSLSQLDGVNPILKDIVLLTSATAWCPPFCVAQGRRSAEEQLKDWLKGVSKLNGIPVGVVRNGYKGTGVGKHMLGLAVDLVPLVGGVPSWDWAQYYPLIDAVRGCAVAKQKVLRWGGVWDKHLNDLAPGGQGLLVEHQNYLLRMHGKTLCDGPHLELLA